MLIRELQSFIFFKKKLNDRDSHSLKVKIKSVIKGFHLGKDLR
jgi:hypothetical protein